MSKRRTYTVRFVNWEYKQNPELIVNELAYQRLQEMQREDLFKQ